MHINWYPGHMKKTKALIQEHLKLVDVVVEILDARIPHSSKNPQIDEILKDKPRVVALNKADLAESESTRKWQMWYKKNGISALPINAVQGQGIAKLVEALKLTGGKRIEKRALRGSREKNVRAMIVGIPNVGKSSLINGLVGQKKAKTGNRPGVTRGKQWIRIREDVDLFDTPGILWPKIEDPQVGMHLAFTGAIKDEILNVDDLAFHLIKTLLDNSPGALQRRYGVEENSADALFVMESIARKRGCIRKGNAVDYEKTSRLVLDEFRKGLLGRISLENPSDFFKDYVVDNG